MMHRIIASVVFVKFKHWKIGHPQRRKNVFGNQLLAPGNLVAQGAETRGHHVRFSGNDQNRVTFLRAGDTSKIDKRVMAQRFQQRR